MCQGTIKCYDIVVVCATIESIDTKCRRRSRINGD